MRYKFLKLGLLLLTSTTGLSLHAQTLFVKQKSETQNAYLLSNINKISFSSENLIVTNNAETDDIYPLANLRYLNFNNLSSEIASLQNQHKALKVYPNPVKDQLHIELSPFSATEKVNIEIFSVQGIVVQRNIYKGENGVYNLNISGLPQGLYLCRITIGRTIETIKFLKQ